MVYSYSVRLHPYKAAQQLPIRLLTPKCHLVRTGGSALLPALLSQWRTVDGAHIWGSDMESGSSGPALPSFKDIGRLRGVRPTSGMFFSFSWDMSEVQGEYIGSRCTFIQQENSFRHWVLMDPLGVYRWGCEDAFSRLFFLTVWIHQYSHLFFSYLRLTFEEDGQDCWFSWFHPIFKKL